ELSGLDGILVDQFDSGSLGAAQVRALLDYVGLGGSLVLVEGGTWRRTLAALPPELVPLRPSGVGNAALGPLGDLAGLVVGDGVQVATGEVASWARVAMADPAGTPLMVEGDYGAGHVLALAFDPLAAPLDRRPDVEGLSW